MSQVQLDEAPSPIGRGRNLLEVSDLSVTFRKSGKLFGRHEFDVRIRAVDNVSFQIKESEIVSLVGESGSGKTTVARCLMGLTPATSGSIRFDGAEVTELRGKKLRTYWQRVQMIYQDPFESLDPGQNVFSIIASPIRFLAGKSDRSSIREDVRKLLIEMDLDPEEVMWKFPHQLSGGQRQRVNIARALAANPRMLIADEPITMLDAAQRLNILSLLKELQRRRKLTILLITHDLASAKVMSQRIFVMYLGKLVEFGPTKEILLNPHHPYVELILNSMPRLADQAMKQQQQQEEDNFQFTWIEQSEKVRNGCIFQPRCKYATEICKDVEPKLDEKSPEDYAACHNPLNMRS